MKKRVLFLLCVLPFCIATHVAGQGGDGGDTGVDIGDDTGSGGTGAPCCQQSQMSSASLMLSGGNFTAMVEPGDLTIVSHSIYDSAVVLIGENSENGSQVAGTENIEAGGSITISQDQFGNASVIYLAGMQNFSVSVNNGKTRSAKGGMAQAKPPTSPLSPLNVINTDDGIVTVGVDAEYRVHYPVHGRIVGRYDLAGKTVILKNGTVLDTTN